MASSSSRYFTKSLFKKATGCPRKLKYACDPKRYPAKPSSSFLQSLAEDGHKVGLYAQAHYPEAIEVGRNGGSIEQLLDETRSLVEDPSVRTIVEGAIKSGLCLIRADILHKANDKELHLIEAKSKAWDSSQCRNELLFGKRGNLKPGFLPFIQDVAFQKLIVQQAFPDHSVKAFLMMPDKNTTNTKIENLYRSFKVVPNHVTNTNGISLGHRIELDEQVKNDIVDSSENLLTKVDVDDIVDEILQDELKFPGSTGESFDRIVERWALEVNSDNENTPLPPLGNQCKTCEFRVEQDNSGFHQCWKEVTNLTPEEQIGMGTPVVDLYYGGTTTNRLIQNGKYFLSELAPEDVGLMEDGTEKPKKKKKSDEGNERKGLSRSRRQWFQIMDEIEKKTGGATSPIKLDKPYLSQVMDSWEYPFHFLDFETTMAALPYTIGRKPFDMVAFQFSHHVLNEDGRVEHKSEFLHAVPGECPNIHFMEALVQVVTQTEGTVFRWGAHENTVLSTLLKQNVGELESFDVLKCLITGGHREMVDLVQVANKSYYVTGSQGSSSIKNLLLPTMEASKTLKHIYGHPNYNGSNFTDMQWWQSRDEEEGRIRNPYSLLDEGGPNAIEEGTDAIIAYNTLQQCNLDPAARAELEISLLRYCELDTLAMAMIVQAWQEFLDF